MRDRTVSKLVATFALFVCLAALAPKAAGAEEPTAKPDFYGAKWIWPDPNPETVLSGFLRKSFTLASVVRRADVLAACDNTFSLYVNGELVIEDSSWETPVECDVGPLLAEGDNTIAVKVANTVGIAGFIFEMRVEYATGRTERIITDETWRAATEADEGWESPDHDDSTWEAPTVVGTYPCEPWQEVAPISHRRLADHIHSLGWVEDAGDLAPSEFKGVYLKPEYSKLYEDFVKVDENGVLRNATGAIMPLTTIYGQVGPDGRWILGALNFDYDQVERDFAAMKESGVNIYLRLVAWGEVLNPDGSWKEVTEQPTGTDLPKFRYNIEVYDYFLDRAQAHGLYVTMHPSHYWGMHSRVIPRTWWTKYYLYDDVWETVERAYERIMGHFTNRPVIVSIQTGEESLICANHPDDPEARRRFREYLKRRYGSIEKLKETWRWGYDYEDRTAWKAIPQDDGTTLYEPHYPFVEGAYSRLTSFDDVTPPPFEMWLRRPAPTYLPVQNRRIFMATVSKEPAWIDFYRMQEELILERLNSWARMLRRACPNHILQFSSGFDFNTPWHFFQVFDRARLEYDIIGVGQHDTEIEPWELEPWARVREEVQNVASYRPYVRAKGSPARGIGTGEGDGGLSNEGRLRYWKSWLFDLVGGGVGIVNSYSWAGLTSYPWTGSMDYDTPVLKWMATFLPAADSMRFTRSRPRILIMRSRSTILSQSSGYDLGNTAALASHLSQLHIPYDIADDESLTMDPDERQKVYLGAYEFVFVPQLFKLLPQRSWKLLEKWALNGGKGLCLGYFELVDEYFNPVVWDDLPAPARLILGGADYAKRTVLEDVQDAEIVLPDRGDKVALEFPERWPAGGKAGFSSVEGSRLQPIVLCNNEPIVTRHHVGDCQVYRCGFALGMAYNATWGLARYPKDYDSLARIYEVMLDEAGVTAGFEAPRNLVVRVSDDLDTILVKERFGIFTRELVADPRLGRRIYAAGVPSGMGVRTSLDEDGTVTITRPLDGYDACFLQATGVVEGEPEVFDIEARRLPNGALTLISNGPGSIVCRIVLDPDTQYVAELSGIEPMEVTTDASGTLQIPLFADRTVLIRPVE